MARIGGLVGSRFGEGGRAGGPAGEAWGGCPALFDLLAGDHCAILGLARIGGGENLGHFLLRLLGFFVAFVFSFGHLASFPTGNPRRLPGGSLPLAAKGIRGAKRAEPVEGRWAFAGGMARGEGRAAHCAAKKVLWTFFSPERPSKPARAPSDLVWANLTQGRNDS